MWGFDLIITHKGNSELSPTFKIELFAKIVKGF